jgi:hypothetical protein
VGSATDSLAKRLKAFDGAEQQCFILPLQDHRTAAGQRTKKIQGDLSNSGQGLSDKKRQRDTMPAVVASCGFV